MSDHGGKRDVTGNMWYHPKVVVPSFPDTFQKVHRSGAVGIRLIKVPPEFLEMLKKSSAEGEQT